MARGWESKSVESQIESAANRKQTLEAKLTKPADIEKLRLKENLILSRTRVLHQLETVENPRYRIMLDRALADLNNKLAEMEGRVSRAATAS